MRTNINIDDKLIKEAMDLSGYTTKKDVVDIALREFVKNRKKKNLLDLKGKIKFDDDYNYKVMREGKKIDTN